MATQDEIVSISLTEGMETKTNKQLSMKPELLKNCSLDVEGTPIKRYGHDPLPVAVLNAATADISSAKKIDVFNDTLIEFTNIGAYKYSSAASVWSHFYSAPIARLDKSRFILQQDNVRISNLSSVIYGDYEMVTYLKDTGESIAYLKDRITKTSIYSISGTGVMRPVIFGTKLGVLFLDAFGALNFYELSLGATISPTFHVLITGLDTHCFDFVVAGNSLVTLTYNSAATLLQYNVFDLTLTQTSSTTVALGGGESFFVNSCLSLFWDSFNSYCWLNYCVDIAGTKYIRNSAYDTSSVNQKAAVDIADVGTNFPYNVTNNTVDGTTMYLFFDQSDATITNGNKIRRASLTVSTNTVAILEDFLLEGTLESHSWVFNDEVHVWVSRALEALASDDQINSAYYAMTFSKHVVARTLRGRATKNFPGGTGIYETIGRPYQNGEVYSHYLRELDILPVVSRYTVANYTACLFDLSYGDLKSSKSVKSGNTLYIPCANPLAFDGVFAYEMGFHHGPYFTLNPSAGGSIANGTYQWKVVYEYYNKKGDLVLSLPSLSESLTLGSGTNNVSIGIRTYKLGELKNLNMKIAVYRTLASGKVFYRVAEVSNSSNYEVVYNDITADGGIENNQTWYYPGDVLENEPPDPCDGFIIFKNRLASVSKDRENYLQYTKEKDFTLEPGHNEFLRIAVEDNNYTSNEKLQTCGILDDKLILFKESSCYYIVGDGPNNSGEQDNFTRPNLIDATVGCSNFRSMVIIPDGLMFQSDKGIWLITRSMDAVYIGGPVEDYNSLLVTSAVINETRNIVKMTTQTGVMLVYDYYHKQWSVFDNYEAEDAVYWNGAITHCKSDGVVRVENGRYDDDGDFVSQGIITGWLKIKSLQGFMRIKRLLILGTYKSSHQMLVKVATDYQDFYWEEHTLTPLAASNYNITTKPSLTDYYNGTIDGVYQWRIGMAKQKCQAVKFSIEDVESGSPGESYRLTDLGILVGFKPGTFKTQKEKMG